MENEAKLRIALSHLGRAKAAMNDGDIKMVEKHLLNHVHAIDEIYVEDKNDDRIAMGVISALGQLTLFYQQNDMNDEALPHLKKLISISESVYKNNNKDKRIAMGYATAMMQVMVAYLDSDQIEQAHPYYKDLSKTVSQLLLDFPDDDHIISLCNGVNNFEPIFKGFKTPDTKDDTEFEDLLNAFMNGDPIEKSVDILGIDNINFGDAKKNVLYQMQKGMIPIDIDKFIEISYSEDENSKVINNKIAKKLAVIYQQRSIPTEISFDMLSSDTASIYRACIFLYDNFFEMSKNMDLVGLNIEYIPENGLYPYATNESIYTIKKNIVKTWLFLCRNLIPELAVYDFEDDDKLIDYVEKESNESFMLVLVHLLDLKIGLESIDIERAILQNSLSKDYTNPMNVQKIKEIISKMPLFTEEVLDVELPNILKSINNLKE